MKNKKISVKHYGLESNSFLIEEYDSSYIFGDYSTILDDIISKENELWYLVAIKFDSDSLSEILISRSCYTVLDFIEIFKEIENLNCISIFEFEDFEFANKTQLDILNSEIINKKEL